MRLTRITLRDFRGVGDSTVEFGPGVTVVEGPNEIGKSSVAHAIRFIREVKASSKHRDIVAAKPIGRDVGPEVEIELQTGPYDLTYRKRWLKSPITELSIRTPKPEQVSGDPAHERFLAILAETVDLDLLEAMDVLQGQSLDQPDLTKISSLRQALDNSAEDQDGHDVLMGKIDAEFGKYFTAGGRPAKEYKAAAEAQPSLNSSVEGLTLRSSAMDTLTTDSADATALLSRLSKESETSKTDLADHEKDALALEALRGVVRAALTEVDDANRLHTSSTHALAARGTLRNDLATRQSATEADSTEVERLETKHDDLQKAFGIVKARSQRLEKDHEDARLEARAASQSVDRKQNHIQVEELSGQAERAEAAEDDRLSAVAELEIASLDEDALSNLTALATELRVAESARSSAAATVIVTPTSTHKVEVDAEVIPTGEPFEALALDTVHIEVDGLVSIEVRPGTPPLELDRAVNEARHDLTTAFADVGVGSLEEARQMVNRRRAAESALTNSVAALTALLGDSTLKIVKGRLAVVSARIALDTELEPTDDLAALERKSQLAAGAEETALGGLGDAQAELEQHRQAVDDAREESVRARAALDVAEQERNRVADDLRLARLERDDSVLEQAVEVADQGVADKRAAADVATENLGSADPDTLDMLVTNARALVISKDEEVKQTQSRVDQLSAVLKVREAEGIYDQLSAAEAARETGQAQYDRLHRSAEATKLLRNALLSHRDEAQKKYAAPFREKIERLGKVVFGRDFQVEISNGLSIETRTLDGKTVPFDSLSAGAREQLSLLGRLACAQLVDAVSGAPVVLDDAMGFSDPKRLTALNAVLGEVGRSAQVILLTCQPERFSGIGGAQVSHMIAT